MLNNPQPSLKQEARSRFYFPLQGPLEICLLEYAGTAAPEGRIVLTCAPVFVFGFFLYSVSLRALLARHVPATWTRTLQRQTLRLGGLETSQGRGCDAALGKHAFFFFPSCGFFVWAGNKEADQT